MSMELQVGVKAFLKNPEGKYLLLKRSPVKYPGTDGSWDIPGGRIDPGMPLLDNLAREIREETGLNLRNEPKLIAAQDILRSSGRHVVRLTCLGEIEGEPVLDPEEHSEYKWLALEELFGLADLDVYAKEVLARFFG
jgi:8-oxo-dGTP diphosphatase